MKRRQAISYILLTSGAAIASFTGYEWLSLNKTPDLKLLPLHKPLIAELAETIIPATDTPGAKDAKVEDFIIKTVLNCEDVKEQNKFLTGLQDVQNYSIQTYKKLFENCNKKEKTDILKYFESAGTNSNRIIQKVENKLLGRSFFSQLKDLTVSGYCTSQLGATQGLAYDYIPVTFQPCISLLPHQKSWATK